jgi:23S rRNA (adenine2503-C2)-methyltransferase
MACASVPIASRVPGVLLALDGSRKYRFALERNWQMEAAYFHVPGRARPEIACVSTQVGCAVGCRFCATALGGFQRNLSAAEIMQEISAVIDEAVERGAAERDFEVSFMGMGEPLANWVNLRAALVETAARYPLISRVSISTVGPAHRVRKMIEELPGRPRVHLQISLHATEDALRRRLIPHAPGAIADLLAAGRLFHEETGDQVCLNYVLLEDVNDREADADWLSRLDRSAFYIKVTHLNEVPNVPPGIVGAGMTRMHQFCRWLEARGMPHKMFIGDGLDVRASCGQMASVPVELKSTVLEDAGLDLAGGAFSR